MGSDIVSITCGASTEDEPSAATGMTYTAQGASGFTGTDNDGCTFDWTVSGDTATLSNAPVTCTKQPETITAFTLTTSDGKHLSGMASGTAMSGATSCTFTVMLTATR